MAPPPDTQHYLLDVATEADLSDTTTLVIAGTLSEEDSVESNLFHSADPAELYPWVADFMRARFTQADFKTFVIRETASGKIRAFAALAYPINLTPAQQAAKDESAKGKLEDLPAGMRKDLATVLFRDVLGASFKFGYNPAEHFHRRGIFVQKEYQRLGFGSWLTRHCNAVTDEQGKATFVGVRQSSKHMFESNGFEVVGSTLIDVKECGDINCYVVDTMRREPKPMVNGAEL